MRILDATIFLLYNIIIRLIINKTKNKNKYTSINKVKSVLCYYEISFPRSVFSNTNFLKINYEEKKKLWKLFTIWRGEFVSNSLVTDFKSTMTKYTYTLIEYII